VFSSPITESIKDIILTNNAEPHKEIMIYSRAFANNFDFPS
jgi:hypothetical protein